MVLHPHSSQAVKTGRRSEKNVFFIPHTYLSYLATETISSDCWSIPYSIPPKLEVYKNLPLTTHREFWKSSRTFRGRIYYRETQESRYKENIITTIVVELGLITRITNQTRPTFRHPSIHTCKEYNNNDGHPLRFYSSTYSHVLRRHVPLYLSIVLWLTSTNYNTIKSYSYGGHLITSTFDRPSRRSSTSCTTVRSRSV